MRILLLLTLFMVGCSKPKQADKPHPVRVQDHHFQNLWNVKACGPDEDVTSVGSAMPVCTPKQPMQNSSGVTSTWVRPEEMPCYGVRIVTMNGQRCVDGPEGLYITTTEPPMDGYYLTGNTAGVPVWKKAPPEPRKPHIQFADDGQWHPMECKMEKGLPYCVEIEP